MREEQYLTQERQIGAATNSKLIHRLRISKSQCILLNKARENLEVNRRGSSKKKNPVYYQKSLRDIWERGRTSEKTVSLHQGRSPDARHQPPSDRNLWTQTPELNRFTHTTNSPVHFLALEVQCRTLHTQPPSWDSHHLSLPFPFWMAIRRRLTECPSPRNPLPLFKITTLAKENPGLG